MASSDSVTVVIYCTLCGNRSVRSALTGRLREAIVRLPRAMIPEVRKGVCIYCQGAIDARIIDDRAHDGRMTEFKDTEGRLWAVSIHSWGDDGGSGQRRQNMMGAFSWTFLVFDHLGGRERRTITVDEYVSDLAAINEHQLRGWLKLSKPIVR